MGTSDDRGSARRAIRRDSRRFGGKGKGMRGRSMQMAAQSGMRQSLNGTGSIE